MWASEVRYTSTYFNTPKRELVIWTVVAPAAVKFKSKSESELLYDWVFTGNQFVLVTSPLRLKISNFIFQLKACGYSAYVISSLMRGHVCRLQLLLVLASAVILGSESRGTHDHSLLSQIRDSPTLDGQVPVFIFPGTGWPSYTPRHWVPFPSSPTDL
jgi:hypothetical protein